MECNYLYVNDSSRAIAISSYEDRFDVMIMSESISRTHFDPIVGVSGRDTHMVESIDMYFDIERSN